MADPDTPVMPNLSGFIYVPSVISMRAEAAINKLLGMTPEEIRRLVPHIVDYTALWELLGAIPAWPARTDAERDRLKTIYDAVKRQRGEVKRRREIVADAGFMERTEAEAAQRRLEAERAQGPPSPRERARLVDADRLWNECGVVIDVDTFPAHPSRDTEEAKLEDVARARMKRNVTDAIFGLTGVNEILDHLNGLAGVLVDGGSHRPEAGLPRRAVSYVRELRFMGHGLAGSDTQDAAFVFTGEGYIDTKTLQSAEFTSFFADAWHHLAPGATIAFDGCDVGRGPKGKAFLGAIGKLFFGTHKWGYLKANTETTNLPIIPEEGLPPAAAATFRWPDDFA